MALDENWGACRHCGATVGSGEAVKVEVREANRVRSTVLCADCASLNCGHCGTPISLTAALDEDQRGGTNVLVCSRCEEDTLLADIVEIRREGDPNYRKRVCGDCLDEISVPTGYKVVRDVPPQEL